MAAGIGAVALAVDADAVSSTVRSQPGITSKRAIAEATGLPVARVAHVIKRIQAGDTGHSLVLYGEIGGKRGWYATDVRAHLPVILQADAHLAAMEDGYRRRRDQRARFRARLGTDEEEL